MYKIGVIGGEGFIGKAVVSKLKNDGVHDVLVLGRKQKSSIYTTEEYQSLNWENPVQMIKIFEKLDVIYYLASSSFPFNTWGAPKKEVAENLIPFISILEVASQVGIKKVIFTSSGGTVYGEAQAEKDEKSLTDPFSPHGIIKLTMEHFLNYFEKNHGLRHEVFRISNVYGPGQDTSKGLGLINSIIEKGIKGEVIRIYGDGSNMRNYVFVDDVSELMTRSLVDNINKSDTLNLCSDESLSIKDILEIVEEVMEEQLKIEFVSERKSDVDRILLSNKKIKSSAPEYKFTPLKEAIVKTYKYLKNEGRYSE